MTQENTQHINVLKHIAEHANKSEIASWGRKRKAIEKLVSNQISPLEDKLLEIRNELAPLYDKLDILREDMVAHCVHPIDMLILNEDHVVCKFCMAKMGVPNLLTKAS